MRSFRSRNTASSAYVGGAVSARLAVLERPSGRGDRCSTMTPGCRVVSAVRSAIGRRIPRSKATALAAPGHELAAVATLEVAYRGDEVQFATKARLLWRSTSTPRAL